MKKIISLRFYYPLVKSSDGEGEVMVEGDKGLVVEEIMRGVWGEEKVDKYGEG